MAWRRSGVRIPIAPPENDPARSPKPRAGSFLRFSGAGPGAPVRATARGTPPRAVARSAFRGRFPGGGGWRAPEIPAGTGPALLPVFPTVVRASVACDSSPGSLPPGDGHQMEHGRGGLCVLTESPGSFRGPPRWPCRGVFRARSGMTATRDASRYSRRSVPPSHPRRARPPLF